MRTFKKGLWSMFLNCSPESLYYFTLPPTEVWNGHFSQDKIKKKNYAVLFLTYAWMK